MFKNDKIKAFIISMLNCLIFYVGHAQVDSMFTIERKFISPYVKGCDSNSSVSKMTFKMTTSKTSIGVANSLKRTDEYRLVAKNKKVKLYWRQIDSVLTVWYDNKKKHCFIIRSKCNCTPYTYEFYGNELIVYGNIIFGKKHKVFGLHFYANNNAVFDFDDQ